MIQTLEDVELGSYGRYSVEMAWNKFPKNFETSGMDGLEETRRRCV